MTKPIRQIDKIFGSLEAGGFPISLQQMLLPEWVTPEVLADDAAAPEIALILAKRLGLRTGPLFAGNPRIELLRRRDTKYKRSIPNKSKSLTAATSIAVSVAETVAASCKIEYSPFPEGADNLRAGVLSAFPGKWLSLRSLLMACWSHGVPVVYLSELKGAPKMDGMVVHAGNRPVIVLAKASLLWSWQLFVLAHEVAHIALGHVAVDEILVDDELGKDAYALADEDLEERAADTFAIEIINGRKDATYSTSDNTVNGRELAAAAYQYGILHHVDPGHVALNFAYRSDNWTVGLAAAKILQGENPPASDVISEAMWGGIDSQLLPADTREFLARATGSISQ